MKICKLYSMILAYVVWYCETQHVASTSSVDFDFSESESLILVGCSLWLHAPRSE